MSHRRAWFVASSVAAHAGIAIGVFASGIWSIDRLDRASPPTSAVAAFLPNQPASGDGGTPHRAVEPLHPKQRVKELTQRVVERIPEPVSTPIVASTTEGLSGTRGTGPEGPLGPPTEGACLTPPCGADAPPKQTTIVKPPLVVKPTILLPPKEFGLNHVAGSSEIHPSDTTKTQMLRDGRNRSSAILKVCVSETGAISSVAMLASTKYPDYDQLLIDGVRGWTYKPFATSGRTVCGTVTFHYAIQ